MPESDVVFEDAFSVSPNSSSRFDERIFASPAGNIKARCLAGASSLALATGSRVSNESNDREIYQRSSVLIQPLSAPAVVRNKETDVRVENEMEMRCGNRRLVSAVSNNPVAVFPISS